MLNWYYYFVKFLETIINFFIVLFLNLKFFSFKEKFPACRFNTIQILGNGPSLNDEIPDLIKNKDEFDFMVVNSFCLSNYFCLIKPSHYVIFDPAFFKPSKVARISSLQESILVALINNVNWDMNLFIPLNSKNSEFYSRITEKNPFIQVFFIRNVPSIGGSVNFSLFLFKKGLANPLYQNVLIVCIFLSIKMKYSFIGLWGSDHSWLANLHVLKDNTISLNDKHLSNSDSNVIKLTDEFGNFKKLHEFLFQLYNVFKGYHLLKSYSKKMGIEIKNFTVGSYIDAFKK